MNGWRFVILISCFLMASTALAEEDNVLTGDTRLACEAILCLSSGDRPGECSVITPNVQDD